MKRNFKLILLRDTVAVYRITMWKNADILEVQLLIHNQPSVHLRPSV